MPFIADHQEFCSEIEKFRILHAHRFRSGMNFYGDDFAESTGQRKAHVKRKS